MANANTPTPRLLDEADIRPGMRILDVGCAMGLLTRELAVRAGPSGEVVGIDMDAARLEQARAEEPGESAAPITYRQADLGEDLPDLGLFDVIVGRRVLMYLPDPAAVLAKLARLLRPGGTMAWHEHCGASQPFSTVPLPQHARLADLIWQTIALEGGRPGTALCLPAMLRDCGLVPGPLRVEAIVIEPDAPGGAAAMARMMLPRMVAAGLIAQDTFDGEGFVTALEAERAQAAAPIIWDHAYLVIARKPAA
ncbi:methyltransferase domain-containing protein [Alteraurantiacibacter buctensis]|uniref:Methyltransferase domain-containing protein n=1 Tax=Alteraurantiacibacter buctensis TaxID=1503981 RepID=A0A844YSY6_9SPHN|nr:methyltransferase domain-containing protein [Alteraurantiacibacter buctensis]MXO71455.1 methyltransferase domain-containing protein [Alteraurantiacibacter buctensis]